MLESLSLLQPMYVTMSINPHSLCKNFKKNLKYKIQEIVYKQTYDNDDVIPHLVDRIR